MRTRKGWGLAAAIAIAVLGLKQSAGQGNKDKKVNSGILLHKVEAGDSLELLAAEYYGDRRHKIYIMIENQLDHGRDLKKGERMRIPVSTEVTVGVGETLATLAAQHLGDERRAKYLAEFNGADAIAAGMTISIPLRVTYTAGGKEPLDAIAKALFADGKKAALLKEYNFLDKTELAAGETIIVPIYLRVQPSKRRPPDADSLALAKKRTDVLDQVRRALPRARDGWKSGDYTAVKRELADLVKSFPYLDTPLVVEVGVLLGSAYVAFDDLETAHATFEQVLERSPKQALDAFHHSPKVREVWTKAGGAVEKLAAP